MAIAVIIALLGFGVYKSVITARLPAATAKGAYSMAIALVAWGIALATSSGVVSLDRKGRPILLESDAAFLVQVMIVCGVIAIGAIVLAVLGLREAAKPRTADEEFAPVPGRGMAKFAIVLSLLFFALPVISTLLARR